MLPENIDACMLNLNMVIPIIYTVCMVVDIFASYIFRLKLLEKYHYLKICLNQLSPCKRYL